MTKSISRIRTANIILAVVLVAILAFIGVRHFTGQGSEQAVEPEYVNCDFVVEESSSDINPGREYVLYTNYACPYCAAFYDANIDKEYSERILLLDKDSDRFKTQGTVSSYMLKLYRNDPNAFESLEAWLFHNQDSWVELTDEQIIELLNQKSGQEWGLDDLEPELLECQAIEQEAPKDLLFVPALYADGKRFDGYVLRLVGD